MHCTALDTQNTVCFADYHRKEQLTLADSASLPELDLLPLLFGSIRNPYRNGNTRQVMYNTLEFEINRTARRNMVLK
ncbi:hypothetical protein T01_7409 [Trichinella spiralis]|uniref:Uncharacterized protein n=1 Tax=Trichinella spiralis TaxID=6334 RepID=A0A0V1AWN4_TRISP|nr:hypothetical protein T01_7409 [Trichinella spiralis]KRY28643.1 hypothetical protein T01_7409 [Trichinella spiralis]